MFAEAHYRRAYERGTAWAEETYERWLATRRTLPREFPFTKRHALAVLDGAVFVDSDLGARIVSVLYAGARVRWRRLACFEPGRKAG
jgi:hypothetical protein